MKIKKCELCGMRFPLTRKQDLIYLNTGKFGWLRRKKWLCHRCTNEMMENMVLCLNSANGVIFPFLERVWNILEENDTDRRYINKKRREFNEKNTL